MAQTIKIKRSGTSGNKLTGSNSIAGEIGMNTADKSLYIQTGSADADVVTVYDDSILHLDDTNNRVGIGTTSPTKSVHLSYTSSSTSNTGDGLAGGAAGGGLLIQNTNTTSNTYANLDFRAATADGRIAYQYTGTENKGDFHFITDNTNSPESQMVIKNDGNVGIGTTSPQATLDVIGTGKFRGSSADDGVVLALGQMESPNSTTPLFEFRTNDVGTDQLEIRGRRYEAITRFSRGSAAGAGVSMAVLQRSFPGADVHGTAFSLFEQADSSASGSTATTVKIRLDSSGSSYFNGGNVGIGTTAPADSLEIATSSPTIRLRDTNTGARTTLSASSGVGGFILNVDSGNSVANSYIDFKLDNTTRMYVNGSGNVGIGTGSSPERALHVKDGALVVQKIESSNTGGVLIDVQHAGTQASNAGSYAGLRFNDNGGHKMSLSHITESSGNGYVQIGTSWATGGEILSVHGSGNVGIGTASPSRALELSFTGSTVGARFTRSDTTGSSTIEFANSAGVKSTIGFNAGTNKFDIQHNAAVRFSVNNSGAATFNEAFTFPTSDGSPNQVLKTDGSGNVTWATEAATAASTTVQDADGDTKIQVEESADEDLIRFDVAGTERFRIGSDVQVMGTTDFNITGSNRRINFTSGTGTVRTSGASSLNLGTSNTDRMTITSAGNVGIGTTSPETKLDVIVDSNSAYTSTMSGVPSYNPSASDVIQVKNTESGVDNIYAGIWFETGNPATNTTGSDRTGRIALVVDNDTSYASNFVFQTRGSAGTLTEKMRITEGGNVGIGTTNPSNQFVIKSGTGVDMEFGSEPTAAFIQTYNRTSSAYGHLRFVTNGETMRLTNTGSVGIGTTSPSQKLQVAGTILADTALTASSSTTAIGIGSESNISDGNSTYKTKLITENNNAKLTTYQYGSYLTLKAGVSGTGYSNNWSKIELRDGGAAGSNNAHMKFYTHGDERMVIDTNGNVGIGTTSPIAPLHVANSSTSTPTLLLGKNQTNGITLLGDDYISGENYVTLGMDYSTNSLVLGAAVKVSSTASRTLVSSQDGFAAKGAAIYVDGYEGAIDFYTSNSSAVRTTGAENTNIANRMRISSSGNVGIGTTSPGQKLAVRGATELSVGDLGGHHNTEFSWLKANTGSTGANVWYKVADITLPASGYSAVSMEIYYETGLNNYGNHDYLDVREVFCTITRNSEATANNSPDNAVLKGRTQDVRVYKTSTGTYELQARHASANATYAVRVRVFKGAPQATILPKMDGTTAGTTSGGTEYTVETAETGADGIKHFVGQIDAQRIHLGNVDLYPSGNSNYIHLSGSGFIPSSTTASSNGSLGTSTYLWNGVFSQKLTLEDGTEGAPAITFLNDTDTGIYRTSSDQLRIVAGGAWRAYFETSGIHSSGNVYTASDSAFRNYGGEWHATTGLTGNGFKFTNTADSVDALAITSAGNGTFAGSLTVNGNIDLNGSDINDINQINGTGSTGWLDFNMDADNLYPNATTDNQTVLGSVTHMNFVGDSNGNGTGGNFYWGYGVSNTDSGTFTQTMDLDRSGNLTLTGALRGPATFTIDPAAHGDDTGTVVIAGNLQVDGTTTTINSTTLTVDDKNITLASGAANAAAANGAGLTVDCGSGTDATFTYDGTNDEWDFNKNVKVAGSVGVTNIVTNKVVKFNGTILDDSSITDTGSLITLGTSTDVSGPLQFTSNVSFSSSEPGRIYKASNHGLAFHGVTGTENDFALFNPAGQLMVVNPTGTNNVVLIPTADGRVGIGTAAPNSACSLEVYKNGADSVVRIHEDAGTHQARLHLRSGGNDARIQLPNTSTGLEIRTEGNLSSGDAAITVQTTGRTDFGYDVRIKEAGIDTTTTSTTATTQVAIDTFAAATFRSARYTIQVTNSTDSTYHITEILLIHDGTTPAITEFGTIFTGSAEATFDADISSGNVRLLATPATTDSMTFKVVRHCITV